MGTLHPIYHGRKQGRLFSPNIEEIKDTFEDQGRVRRES